MWLPVYDFNIRLQEPLMFGLELGDNQEFPRT